jgi:hypothetical protein
LRGSFTPEHVVAELGHPAGRVGDLLQPAVGVVFIDRGVRERIHCLCHLAVRVVGVDQFLAIVAVAAAQKTRSVVLEAVALRDRG